MATYYYGTTPTFGGAMYPEPNQAGRGALIGGLTGFGVGALVGGPVGALALGGIGAAAGAGIGASAGPPSPFYGGYGGW